MFNRIKTLFVDGIKTMTCQTWKYLQTLLQPEAGDQIFPQKYHVPTLKASY